MKYILSIAIVSFILCGCERETTINMPPHIPKLVAEGLNQQNELPLVRISRTRAVTDPRPSNGGTDPYLITNATAMLYENDVLKETLHYNASDEIYEASTTTIATGKTYKIVITAPNFPNAEATSFTPAFVGINSLVFTAKARSDRNGDPQDEVKISFIDNAATEDYYLIRIWNAERYRNYYCVNTNDKDVEKLVYDDPFYPEECLQPQRLLLSDKNFNGQTKTISFYIYSGELDPRPSPGGIQRATVELLHINKDYFEYTKSLSSYENVVDNPFAEPFNLYSNVKNGYGLFTTYGMAVDSIR
jgi:hypothetical protein